MKMKKFMALGMAGVLSAAALVGCDKTGNGGGNVGGGNVGGGNVGGGAVETDEIKDFTMFIGMAGSEINEGNDIQEIIAEKTGVRVTETWLTGQDVNEAISAIIVSDDLPDFIDAGDASITLYENGQLVAWDPYLEKYPNLKEMYSDKEWDMFRQADGKIYWANVFCNHYGEEKSRGHNDEAFWVQVRVLEEAGYPKIETLDEYFDLLEGYYANHKTFTDPSTGAEVDIIPYTILCEDWYYYCLENAPQFLDGYPNDGSVIVDTTTMTIVDYNTTDTAKKYFAKLNEEYNKGIIDKEFATQTHDEYLYKLCTGAVLGMVDQNWNFNYTCQPSFAASGLDEIGCEYVPLGLTIEKGMDQMWHTYGDTLNNSSGCAVTTACDDPDLAFQFLSALLDQDIHDLRFWGVQGVDYLVDADGMYYRTQEMRDQQNLDAYKASHMCSYSYMPQWLGTSKDGKNAMTPGEQESEFFASFSEPLKACFDAYGATSYPDLIGSKPAEMGCWFPMYSKSNSMSNSNATDGCVAWADMGSCKHQMLPEVVMSGDFEKTWSEYMKAYEECNPQAFLDEMQEELDARVAKGQ